jgi:uncharacterized protein YecT (DUF1311 family)
VVEQNVESANVHCFLGTRLRKWLVCSALIVLGACVSPPVVTTSRVVSGEQSVNDDCENTTFTQTDMNLCAIARANRFYESMEKNYQALMAKVSPVGKMRLRLARNAWEVYRAEQCAFDTLGTLDGSVHPMIVSECYLGMDQAYAERLALQLQCEEGDLSCGGQ